MKKLFAICTIIVCMGESVTLVNANVFNMSGGQKSLEFVTVGNPGNAPYPGHGWTIHYTYKIGKFDVTAGQYTEFLNAVAKTDTYGLYNWRMGYSDLIGCCIQQSGSPGNYSYSVSLEYANRPVNYVSWADAVRFANWLNNGQPTGPQDSTTTEDGSYNLVGIVDLQQVIRKPDAHYVIPALDEWYKAGYYDPYKPGGPGYWMYPTRSDNVPSNILSPPGTNNANFYANNTYSDPIHMLTEVGAFALSPGPYGTVDQGGNVFQWVETKSGDAYRFYFGGALWCDASFLRIDKNLQGSIPGREYYDVGFRIAEMPTPVPASVVLSASKLGQDTTGAVAGDPVNTATGNFYLNESDLIIPGPGMSFEFARAYNSSDSYSGSFGPGWTHSYNVFVQSDPCSTMVLVKWGDGQGHYYIPDSNDFNSYHPAIGAVYDKLKLNPNNTWLLTRKDQTRYSFNTSGKLISIVDKNGNCISLSYDGGRLIQITDTANRIITVAYNASNLVKSITDPNTRQIIYGYNTTGKLTSVTDPNGNSESYAYDSANGKLKTIYDKRGIPTLDNVYDNNRVVSQINGRGKISAFDYNVPDINQTTITDPLGRKTVHIYDPNLRLISITDPCGHTISYTYDNQSNRTSVIDQNGNTRYFTYDDKGNVLRMKAPPADPNADPNNPNFSMVTVVTYDANNNPLTKIDANGTSFARTWIYQYDSGNLICTIDPNNYQSLRSYNANGLLASETDANGHTTKYIYDPQGNLTDVNDALGNITHYTYDAVGRVLTKKDARGNTTAYSYDKNSNLLTETDPKGKITYYVYDKNNNKTSVTDKRGHTWTYYYNENNILNREVDPNGFETLYGYDNADNRISVKDKRGKTTVYTYNVLNRLIDVSDPLGHHTTYAYDAKGNKISQTNALSKTWTYKYDTLDRLIEERDPLGNTTKYEYDLLGRKTAIINARGSRTQYGYDKLDRLTQVTDALGNITRYQYDPVGNLTTITNANNKVSTRQYDALHRLISEADPLENTTHYQYDHVGNLVTKIDAMDQTTNYSYDQLNRIIDIGYPDSTTVHYDYDENGNRIAMTDWNGTSSFEFNALNRMAASVDAFGNRIDYLYNAAGNREAIIYPDDNLVIYDYDAAGRLDTVIDWNGSETWYDYDAADNLQGVLLPNWAYQFYTYDDASRLISVDNFDGDLATIGTFQYALDAVGNRIEIKETGTLDPIISYSNANYAYDDADRILTDGSCSYSFNDNGDQTNLTCGSNSTQYFYDPKDLLVGVSRSGLNIEHKYDGLGNRIAETINGTQKHYALDMAAPMSQVLCETDASGNVTAYYIYGAGLLAKVAPDGTERYYHYDGLGSTVALTDGFGYLTDRCSYTPFGELANSQGSMENPFKYVGQFGVMTEPDGSLFMRARFYDPITGRFLSKDPIEGSFNTPLSLHNYVYVMNAPLNNIDASGTTLFDAQNFFSGFSHISAGVISSPIVIAGEILYGIGGLIGDSRIQNAGYATMGYPVKEISTGASYFSYALHKPVPEFFEQQSQKYNTALSQTGNRNVETVIETGALLGQSLYAVKGATNNLIRYDTLSGIPPIDNAAIGISAVDTIQLGYGLYSAGKLALSWSSLASENTASASKTVSGGVGSAVVGNGSTSPVKSSQVTPQVNVPVITSANPQTYSQTYTSTTRKYR